VIPRSQWRFTSPTSIAVDGGFQRSHWYELIYRSSFAPVAGAGLLALRDIGTYLRRDHDLVLAGGISQTGRVLREFLYQGLNRGEDDGSTGAATARWCTPPRSPVPTCPKIPTRAPT
jgi:hypothetical protein